MTTTPTTASVPAAGATSTTPPAPAAPAVAPAPHVSPPPVVPAPAPTWFDRWGKPVVAAVIVALIIGSLFWSNKEEPSKKPEQQAARIVEPSLDTSSIKRLPKDEECDGVPKKFVYGSGFTDLPDCEPWFLVDDKWIETMHKGRTDVVRTFAESGKKITIPNKATKVKSGEEPFTAKIVYMPRALSQ